MLKSLLTISGLLCILQIAQAAKITIDRIAQGDTLNLNPNNDDRWPVFEDLSKQGFSVYPVPEKVRCLTGRHEKPDFELLDALIHGMDSDKFLVKYSNGTVALLDSFNTTGAIFVNSSLFKDFKEGFNILFGRIYAYKGWGYYSFRVYYQLTGSSEIRFYDHRSKKDEVSLWQPRVDPQKVKLISNENPITKSDFLALVAKDGSTNAENHLKILRLVEPVKTETELKEVVIDLAAGLGEAQIPIDFSFTHFSSAHVSLMVGEQQSVLNNLLFGGISKSESNRLTLFSCLLSEENKAVNCITLYNSTLEKDETLLDARPFSRQHTNPSTVAVQLVSKTKQGTFVISQVDLNSSIRLKSMRPLTFSRTPYEEANMHEYNVAYNSTSALEPFDGDAFIVHFGQGERYLAMNKFSVSEPDWGQMNILLPSTFKQIMRPSKFGGPALVVVDNDRCFRTFKYRVTHSLQIDTSKYANNTEIVLWYYRRQGGDSVPFNDTLTLNYTGGRRDFALKQRSLRVVARNASSLPIDARASNVRGYFEAGPELLFDGEITPSYAKINANKMRFFVSSDDHFQEVTSSNFVGTVDRAIDLQNMHGYSECNYEIAREIAVTCKNEFRVQFKNNKVKQIHLGEFTTYLLLISRDNPTSSSLAIVNHQSKSSREIELPFGATKQALQVTLNYIICLYVNREGVVESTYVDLETFDTRTSNYLITDVLGITATPADQSIGFSVLTELETFFFAFNSRYNSSDSNSQILTPSQSKSNSVGGLKPKSLCFIKRERSDSNAAVSDGNKLYWSAQYNGISALVGINYSASLESMLCGLDGFYYTQGQNLVKVFANMNKADVIADRYEERIIYAVGGKTELVYSYGDFDYALVNDGSSTVLKMLNRKGTTFILSRAPERVSLEYQTGNGNSVLLPIDLTLAPRPDSAPINLSKMGNYTYSDNKLNFTIEVGSSQQSTGGHFWSFVDPSNAAIKVHNRFTYLRDLTYAEDFQVVDVTMAGQLSAYLVRSTVSGKYSLVFKGPDIDEKVLLFHSREVRETPYIAYFNYYIEEARPVLKAMINVANGTSMPTLLTVNLKNGKVTTKNSYGSVSKRSERRFASVGNNTYIATQQIQPNGSFTTGISSDIYIPEVSMVNAPNSEAFDLVTIRDTLILVVKQSGKNEVLLGSIERNGENSTFIWTTIPLDIFKESTVSLIRCSPTEVKDQFSCTFIGSSINTVTFKLEKDRSQIVIMRIRSLIPYKNMQIEDGIYLDQGLILIGRRSEIILNTTRRDLFGMMFYPLNAVGDSKDKSVYMVGGLDKYDLEKLNLGARAQIKKGENQHSVILGSPEGGFKLFNVQNPTVLGKVRLTRLRS